MSAAKGVRERAREALVAEIKDTARRHLAEHGAAALSVRAVTRDLGMASSAVYRYFPSRDALLTALIVDAYNGVGEAAESAAASVPRDEPRRRWRAAFDAVREWAIAHPQEYALIFGSPVPGYAAPQETTAAAGRVPMLLARIAIDAALDGVLQVDPAAAPDGRGTLDDDVRRTAALAADWHGLPLAVSERDADAVASAGGAVLPTSSVLALLDAWTRLYGTVSFELFGHYQGVVDDRRSYLAYVADSAATAIGLPSR